MRNLKAAGFVLALFVLSLVASAYVNQDSPAPEYAHVTVLESQASGGVGRSRLVITYPDGKQEQLPLENYKSMVGINFENVASNERAIVTALKKMTGLGFEIRWVESGVSEGIYITKYIMTRK